MLVTKFYNFSKKDKFYVLSAFKRINLEHLKKTFLKTNSKKLLMSYFLKNVKYNS